VEASLPVHVLQLSDIHFTATGRHVDGRDADVRLATVLDTCLAEAGPDLVVLTGDLTDDGTAAACRRLRDALDQLEVPILAVPGNHDVPAVVSETFPTDVATAGGWRIVGIDTSRDGQIHGQVDVTGELRRLDAWDRRPTLLAMHHPPLSPSRNAWFQLDGAADLLAALASRPQVKGIVSGHLHHPFALRSEAGTPVLGCPSTLIAFRHDGEELVVGGSDATGARWLHLTDAETLTSTVLTA
jgi:Icc protein